MQYIINASFLSNILNILCCILVYFLTQSLPITIACVVLFLLFLRANIVIDMLFPLGTLIYAIVNFHFHWSFGVIGIMWFIMVAMVIYGVIIK